MISHSANSRALSVSSSRSPDCSLLAPSAPQLQGRLQPPPQPWVMLPWGSQGDPAQGAPRGPTQVQSWPVPQPRHSLGTQGKAASRGWQESSGVAWANAFLLGVGGSLGRCTTVSLFCSLSSVVEHNLLGAPPAPGRAREHLLQFRLPSIYCPFEISPLCPFTF